MALVSNRPSSFARVIACPGSRAFLTRTPLKDEPSIYAETGTAAHELASRCLLENKSPIEFLGQAVYTSPEFGPITVDPAMVRGVCVYVARVSARMKRAKLFGIEDRTSIPDLDMDKGGTVDFWSYEENPGFNGHPQYGVLSTWDYKNGSGVEVPLISRRDEDGEPDWTSLNAQVGSYLWGKLRSLEGSAIPVGAVQVLEGVVVQPNAQSWTGEPKTIRMLRAEFFDWVQNTAFPAVAASRQPDAPLHAGEHCRKTFCPAKAICPAVLRDSMAAVLAAQNAPRPAPGTVVFAPYEGG